MNSLGKNLRAIAITILVAICVYVCWLLMLPKKAAAEETATPGGFYDQCRVHRSLCNVHGGHVGTLAQLRQVNSAVNAAVVPVHNGSWDPSSPAGDCKVYAMKKYARLLALGWPTSAVRLAERGTPAVSDHIVVMVTLGGEEWVLDNLRQDIVRKDETGYQWRKIQSRANPQRWETL